MVVGAAAASERHSVRRHYTFMNYITLILLAAIPRLVVFVLGVAVPRFRMERRARALLAEHPDVERTSVYLELHSTFAGGKQREIDAKIAEMQPQGWTFLRAMEASPLRTLFSWGGGLTLHFIRKKV
jgi:hypothetical protein